MPRETPYSKQLFAELLLDLKGSKSKTHDWMTIAEMSAAVVRHCDNSRTEAAKRLRVSTSLLNSVLRLRDLDPGAQELVRKGLVLFDSAHRLNTIQPSGRQYEVAKLLIGLSNKQQRDLIQHALRYPELDLADFRMKLTHEKERRESVRVVILPISEEKYRQLKEAGKGANQPVQDLLMSIISEWLECRKNAC